MKRKIETELLTWKSADTRMPLLLYGARQVGKTHILCAFGKQNYKNVAYFNLETNEEVNRYFDKNIEPKHILTYLETQINARILPQETLILFDEIQSCERALTSLKYFRELAPEYHVAAAGSLLGVAVNREKSSFPVGNVNSFALFPFDFEEFLWSQDKEMLAALIKTHYSKDEPLPAPLHEQALELYRNYLIIGGMPRAISTYNEEKSLIAVGGIQNEIVNNYTADMSKYADNAESVKIKACYNSIPQQLAKENKKFQYKVVQKGGNSNLFGVALDWLSFAGVVNKCAAITEGTVPLKVYTDLSNFKLYMSDCGLLTLQSGTPLNIILNPHVESKFMGAITENYVAQAFTAKKHPLYFWKSESKTGGKAEVDFILQIEDKIVPVEVKSGTNVASHSLSVFTKRYGIDYAIRISAKNFGFEKGIKSVPLYAAFCV
ncbi:MAG: ATP-binding protein [Clostridiales Family XIII bacterium]|jgi:predicted AAA+ superfamily ATPase|nr:ATP-binding protein [Clostridiales Family XIII bacterium]